MIRPRRFGHRGTVIATGFVIDTALVGLAEARRRVLAWWTAGAVVRAYGTQLVITGLRPTRIHVAAAPGPPLVEQRGMSAAMPLDRDEAEALAVPGAIVLAAGGVAEVVPIGAMHVIDVAAWIDLREFVVAEVEALAAPPVRAVIPAAPSGDVRVLTGMAAADREAGTVASALMAARRGQAAPGKPSWQRRIVAWFADRFVHRRPALPAGDTAARARAAGSRSATSPGSATPAPARSPLERLRTWLAEALWRSQLGVVLGRKHAAYLHRVLELFDRGELDEALRLAIPIGGEAGESARLGVGVPRPRQDLRLSFTSPHGRSAIPLADQAISSIRERYRAAAARLEQQGRIDEAAFVLAELLADVPGAIALLERHERFALAARLAEGRGLAPGLVVRLWFLAGDRERAIDTARRHRAWADAVARLERAGDTRAAVLRTVWADHLADAGDFVQAVEVAWPVMPSRALVGAWIDRGIAAEGTAAARLLVKKLIVAPDDFEAVAPAILAILDDTELDAIRRRRVLVEALIDAPPSPELRTIARPALRALLRDQGAGTGADARLVDQLVRFADDAALRADRPAVLVTARPPALVDRATPLELRWHAGDAGAVPVYDAAVLPGGRLLVALGELGVRMIGRDGRTAAHIDQPAARLVVSDHGTRALAIAPRGEVQRIARLDLIERRGAHWCDAACDGGAATFDGDLWIVTRGREVLAVDTTTARWRAVWGIETEPATARCTVRREGPLFVVEASSPGTREHWYFDGFTLRRRRGFDPIDAQLVAAWLTRREEWIAVTPDGLWGPDWKIALEDAPPIALEIEGDIAAVAQRRNHGVTVTAADLSRQLAAAILHLEAATAVSLRLASGTLTAGDDRGRIVVVDLHTGAVVRDLRASA